MAPLAYHGVSVLSRPERGLRDPAAGGVHHLRCRRRRAAHGCPPAGQHATAGDWVVGRSQQGAEGERTAAGSGWFILDMRTGAFMACETQDEWHAALAARGIPGTTMLIHPGVPFFHELLPCAGILIALPLVLWLWVASSRRLWVGEWSRRRGAASIDLPTPEAPATAQTEQAPEPRTGRESGADRRFSWRAMGLTTAAFPVLVVLLAALAPLFHSTPPGLAPVVSIVVLAAGPLCWVVDAGFSGLELLPLVQSAPLVLSVGYLLVTGLTTRRSWKCILGGALWIACSFFPTLAIS